MHRLQNTIAPIDDLCEGLGGVWMSAPAKNCDEGCNTPEQLRQKVARIKQSLASMNFE